MKYDNTELDQFTCVICNKEKHEWGNDPYPIKETGYCCKECDDTVVLKAKLEEWGF